MIQHITGGAWGIAIRRLLEAGARTIPVMALLFVPIALGLGHLYEWAQPEHVAHDTLLQHKALYLNVPFFLARAVFYFVTWALLARALSRWSLRQDESFDPTPAARLELISRGGLVLLALTMSFAAVDWAMSLEPHWFSTIYGVIFMGGSALTAFAVVIPIAALLMQHAPLKGLVTPDQLSDLGKLMLAFVMLWAYFNFSQFLIIWSGNIPEETPWYLKRIGELAPGLKAAVGRLLQTPVDDPPQRGRNVLAPLVQRLRIRVRDLVDERHHALRLERARRRRAVGRDLQIDLAQVRPGLEAAPSGFDDSGDAAKQAHARSFPWLLWFNLWSGRQPKPRPYAYPPPSHGRPRDRRPPRSASA